ncbi:G2/mitotic-specific cyclin S13-7 [Capsicum annuum]|uniref:G2/mitotic-specific cyclin S13-7 n=1 Tax=Capsicum annuum TaxID=4072 RepID=A0A2G2Z932_CAPAN|nr:G2/mitotic-specific cyclin S13-7 [Capsicum annuum]KAF3668870.1 G2/mitotic-specific cyclin S13-7 [Capsicum annuum]PHT78522.1 G2/mitotic-specific cyclin S13-7 [Capsicum annuum]
MAAEGRNQKALGDIGNLAVGHEVEGNPLHQKSMDINIKGTNVAQKVPAGRKPAQNKAIIKPRPEEIIAISPDTPFIEDCSFCFLFYIIVNYTSIEIYDVFVNFIKAACGLSKNPKELIMDIDAADVNNELAFLEYVEDTYSFYKLDEMENMVYFLAELGLMNYETIIYCPSMIAASVVYAARHTLNQTSFWYGTLKVHTGFSETQIIEGARMLVRYHSEAANNKLKVLIWNAESQPNRNATLGVNNYSRPNLVLTGHQYNAEFVLAIGHFEPFMLPGGLYTIEFQNRGLSHAYILLFLHLTLQSPFIEHIDTITIAEIPDMEVDLDGYNVVSNCMMYGPYGDLNPQCPCMKQGKYNKHFPKKFNSQTSFDEDGIPIYRRRNTRSQVKKNNILLDNRFVVPYNRNLIIKFDAHINIELCNYSSSVKYLFKYVNKGSDRETTTIECTDTTEVHDEIKRYLDCSTYQLQKLAGGSSNVAYIIESH